MRTPQTVMTPTSPGYAIHDKVFEPQEMVRALAELDAAALDRTKAGARHVLNVPIVSALAADSRMRTIASGYVGPNPVPFRATLFDKSPNANWLVVWHQDTALPLRGRVDAPGWGPWSTKAGLLYAHAPAWALETVVALRISLDDSSSTNGPLRVLPKTHLSGVFSDEQVQDLARQVQPVDCVASSGGIIVMRPLIVHSSSKALDDRPRRVLHIEYAAALNLGENIELATG